MNRLKMLIDQISELSLLYVEDNEQARIETLETLGVLFKQITPAKDGREGLEKFRRGSFDLVITDIRMPEYDGISMIEAIREVDKDIAIVIVSAYDETNYFTNAIKLGVEGYLLKPFAIEELISVVQKVTEKIFLRRELLEYKETLEKRVQEQLEQMNRQDDFIAQQARLASMGEMINNIAHQWRQPLNRINSNVAVMGRIIHAQVIDRDLCAKKIGNIKLNTKYMSDTIEDFANYFHPDKRQISFDLAEVLNGALNLLMTRLEGIDINVSSDEHVTAFGFEKEYQQVLLAILNNAIDNFETKGIKRRRLEINIKGYPTVAYISIQDNGGGIEAKDIRHIFDPYYTTKHSDLGTGLGLYMAKMLIENSMHGHLNAKNMNGGACFEIEIAREEKR
jgi:two-component system NtrC family sensor kinase